MPANPLYPVLMGETMCWGSEPNLTNRSLFVVRSILDANIVYDYKDIFIPGKYMCILTI
jgi:hypothetical protein